MLDSDEEMMAFLVDTSIVWRKLFERAQDILREIRKKQLLLDDLYVEAVRVCEIEELPRRYRYLRRKNER